MDTASFSEPDRSGQRPRIRSRSRHRPRAWRILPYVIGLYLCPAPVLPAAAEQASRESGTVIRVTDGDTVTIRFADRVERRVRLIGVDAPEVDDPREDVAFHAFLSTRFSFHHLYLREVRLTYDFSPQDEYGRVLAYVWLGEGELFNELVIREGFAAAFLKYPYRKDYQEWFRGAEAQARKEKRGFWRRDAPAIIPASEVRSQMGRLISVRFRCARFSRKKAFLYLESEDGFFEAVVPGDRRRFFPDLETCAGKEITVTGFLEEFRGRSQVLLAFPRQLRLT